MAVKTAASSRETYQPHLAKGKLKAEGISAVVVDEHLVQIDRVYSQAIDGVKVQVPEAALGQACKIRKADFVEEFSSTAVR